MKKTEFANLTLQSLYIILHSNYFSTFFLLELAINVRVCSTGHLLWEVHKSQIIVKREGAVLRVSEEVPGDQLK